MSPSFLDGIQNTSRFGNMSCPESDGPTRPTDFYGDPASRGPVYLYYNSIIGGVRLSQERASLNACQDEVSDLLYYGKCSEDRRDYMLPPQLHPSFYPVTDRLNLEGGDTVYFLSGTARSEIRKELRELENRVWLAPQTEKIEILFATYNPQLQVVTATFIFFHINVGGHIYKHVQPVSLGLHHYSTWREFVSDGVLLLLILRIFTTELYEIYKSTRRFGFKQGLLKYSDIWNMVDWSAVIYFIVLAILWIWHLGEVAELRELLSRADVMLPGSFADDGDRTNFFQTVHRIVIHTHASRIVVAFYPFVLVTRFFKAFSAQPRLAIVTETLMKSGNGILHFGVVFLSITTVYIISAMAIFGAEIREYSTMGRAGNSVLRIMMGDFNWDELAQVGRPQTAVWFWSFTWLVNLILLNMLLAIIMDVYAEVKGNIGSDAETLISQAIEIMGRWKQRTSGRAISINVVLLTIDPSSEYSKTLPEIPEGISTNFTVASIMEEVPGLPEVQAISILADSFARWEAKCGRGATTLADAALTTNKIFVRCEQLHYYVQQLVHMHQMTSSLSVAHTKVVPTKVKGHVHEALKDDKKMVENVGETSDVANLASRFEEIVRASLSAQLMKIEDVLRPTISQIHRIDSQAGRTAQLSAKNDSRPLLCADRTASLCSIPTRAAQDGLS